MKEGVQCIVRVKVIPKASSNEFVEWEGDELKIRIKGVPEKGEVNQALVVFMAKSLGIPKSHVELISGQTSRHKRLNITGVAEEDMKKLVNSLLKRDFRIQ